MKKAAEPDGVVIEMLSALANFGINNITKIIKEIYDSGEILESLRSIFIAIPKMAGANECELHQWNLCQTQKKTERTLRQYKMYAYQQ